MCVDLDLKWGMGVILGDLDSEMEMEVGLGKSGMDFGFSP